MDDLISLIVPIYNVEGYLRKCIDSILVQTYNNLEILLVNDGSPDSSGIICDEYAKKDPRIKVIHKENGGLSDARNKGLDIAVGNYIGFVDGDDYIEPDMYQTLYHLIKEYNTDLSMISYNNVKNGITRPRVNTNTIRIFEKMEALQSIIIDKEIQSYVWNKLYKAEILQDIRFPIGIMYEDVSTMLKIFKKMNNIVYFETPKYNYVFRENSIVNDYSHQKQEDCLSVVIDNYYEVEEFPDLDKYRCYSVILWMVRLYGFMIRANDPDNAFIKKHYDLFQKAYERHKEYIVDNLDPAKRIILFAMLWDLDKSREVVKVLYGLN